MKTYQIPVPTFDLGHTLDCGQVLRWKKIGDWWYGIVDESVIKIKQNDGKLLFHTRSEEKGIEFIKDYFRLGDDLPSILSQIDKDEKIKKALQKFYGLRIVRQDPWECLISYICATYKNIPAIKDMIFNLSKKFGQKINFGDYDFYTFPGPSTLTKAGLNELRNCGLGYRAKYVLETSRRINNNEFDLESLRKLNYRDAKKRLISKGQGRKLLPGVGQKVADCVLLFSLDKLDAFAVDVRVKRAILKFYSQHFDRSFVEKVSGKRSITDKEYETINAFGRNYFGNYAGYAQQYLFYYERSLGGKR